MEHNKEDTVLVIDDQPESDDAGAESEQEENKTPAAPTATEVIDVKWTTDVETILLKWKSQAFVHMWKHERSMAMYNTLNSVLTYPAIILSMLSSAIAALSAGSTEFAKWVTAGSSFSTTVLLAVAKQIKPGEVAQKHRMIASQYAAVLRTFDIMMLERGARPEADQFMNKIRRDLDHLISMRQDPPWLAKFMARRKFGDLDMLFYGESGENVDSVVEICKRVTEHMRQTDMNQIETRDMKRTVSHVANRHQVYPEAPMPVAGTGGERRRSSIDLRSHVTV
jgi:hypothetical protein